MLCTMPGAVKADSRHFSHLWNVDNRYQIVVRATELGIISIWSTWSGIYI